MREDLHFIKITQVYLETGGGTGKAVAEALSMLFGLPMGADQSGLYSTGAGRCQIIHKVITHQGTGEVAQGLRTLASLTKDKSLISSMHGDSPPPITPVSGDLEPSSGLHRHLYILVYIFIPT